MLAIPGFNKISILTPLLQTTHHPVARALATAGLRSSPNPANSQSVCSAHRCLHIAAELEFISRVIDLFPQ